MKCPICNNPRIRYDTKLTKVKDIYGKHFTKRENFNATCSKCGYKGEIK